MEANPTTFQPLQYRYTDFEKNFAMASRDFDSTDFASVAVLTEGQLLTAIRENLMELILIKLCEKLDSLRADQVKALAIQNMYRCEESRARLWFLGANGQLIPQDEQADHLRQRNQQLQFCQDGIGLSANWEIRLKTIIARIEGLYQYWAALCDKLDPHRAQDAEGCHAIAQHIIREQRWLRDQDGIANVSMRVLAEHRGIEGLNFVMDGADDASRGRTANFTWVSFR